MITKNLKIYLMLMFLVICLSLLTGGNFFYNILIFQVVLLFMMRFLLYKNNKNLYLFLYIESDTVNFLRNIEINFDCYNAGIIPVSECEFNFSIENNYFKETFESDIATIRGDKRIIFKKKTNMVRRGIYNKGKIIMEYTDPLHLFLKTLKHFQDIDLTIYPKIYDINYFYIPNTQCYGLKTIKNTVFEDYSSIKNIREYIYGDNIKKVHWKLSSKLNKLYVKEYNLIANPRMNLFIDGNYSNYLLDKERITEDLAVEIATAIIKYTLKLNYETNIIYNFTDEKIVGKSLADFENVLKSLATFSIDYHIPFYELVIKESQKLFVGSFLCLITPQLDDKLFNTIIRLSINKYNISIILLSKDVLSEELREKVDILKRKGVNCYLINNSEEIIMKLEEFPWINDLGRNFTN